MRTILFAIKEKGPISKKELQELTHLSWGTVTNLVNALVQKGYVYMCDKLGTGAGRKIELFDIDNKNLVIAASIRNDSFSVIVTDLKGREKSNKTVSYTVMERDYILSELSAVIDSFMMLFAGKIKIISFAVQGFVDKKNGISRKINRIENWENVDLKSYFEKRYAVPVLVEHDINCTLKFEMSINRAELSTVQNALLISIEDQGIGMAILANGAIYNGAHGEAGEIGEVFLENQTGRFSFDKILYNKNRDGSDKEYENFGKMIDAADAGDVRAKEKIEKICASYGLVLVNVTTVFDPEVVILHGRINAGDSTVVKGVLKVYEEYAFGQRARLIFSGSDHNAAVNGAALIAGERLIDGTLL